MAEVVTEEESLVFQERSNQGTKVLAGQGRSIRCMGKQPYPEEGGIFPPEPD